MTKQLRVVAVGDDVAILLPEEFRSLLGVHAGGTVTADASEAGLRVVVDNSYKRAMTIAREVMERDKETLATLAR